MAGPTDTQKAQDERASLVQARLDVQVVLSRAAVLDDSLPLSFFVSTHRNRTVAATLLLHSHTTSPHTLYAAALNTLPHTYQAPFLYASRLFLTLALFTRNLRDI